MICQSQSNWHCNFVVITCLLRKLYLLTAVLDTHKKGNTVMKTFHLTLNTWIIREGHTCSWAIVRRLSHTEMNERLRRGYRCSYIYTCWYISVCSKQPGWEGNILKFSCRDRWRGGEGTCLYHRKLSTHTRTSSGGVGTHLPELVPPVWRRTLCVKLGRKFRFNISGVSLTFSIGCDTL